MSNTNIVKDINIICLIGRSASGKDTIKKQLLHSTVIPVQDLIPITTRPIRIGETDGIDYVFYKDDATYDRDVNSGKIMESRSYDTSHGRWKYGTPVPEKPGTYVIVSAIDQYYNICDFIKDYNYEDIHLFPFYLRVPEEILIQRALDRELKTNRDFNEMCRRFCWEHDKYTEDKLKNVIIIDNKDIKQTVKEIISVVTTSIHTYKKGG